MRIAKYAGVGDRRRRFCSRKSADFLPRSSDVTSFLCSRKSADFLPRATRPGPRAEPAFISLPATTRPLCHLVSALGSRRGAQRTRVQRKNLSPAKGGRG